MEKETEFVSDNASDADQWAALQAEVGSDVEQVSTPELVEEQATEEAPKEQEAEAPPQEEKTEEKQPDRLSYEDLETRYKNLNGALAEERGKRREQQERMDRMQAFLEQFQAQQQAAQRQQEDQYLTPEEIAFRDTQEKLQSLEKQNKELADWKQNLEAKTQAEQQEQEILGDLSASEKQFAAQTPDYFDAADHLMKARSEELKAFYPDTPEADAMARQNGYQSAAAMRSAVLKQEAIQITVNARQMGTSPAQMVYQLAKGRGFTGSKPAAPAAPQPSKVEAVRQGQQAASSLSNGASSAPDATGFPTLSELGEMYMSDPDKADQIWKKMSEAGAL